MRDSIDKQNFSTNLQYLCTFYSSASEVCRKIHINRQQFNRYLHGECLPSFNNLKKICDFFGVEGDEIVMDSAAFSRRVSPPQQPSTDQALPPRLTERLLPLVKSNSALLERYTGYYYRYFYSQGYPGYVYRSFNRVYQEDGITYLKHIERVRKDDLALGGGFSIKYNGIVIMMAGRLFIVETEPFLNATVSETILTPSHRPSEHYIPGLQLYTSACSDHQPAAARVVFEYLGKKVDVRQAMRQCRLIHHTESEIADGIGPTIANTISPDDMLLHPLKI